MLGLFANGMLLVGLVPTIIDTNARVPALQAIITTLGLAMLASALAGLGATLTAVAVGVGVFGWSFIVLKRRA